MRKNSILHICLLVLLFLSACSTDNSHPNHSEERVSLTVSAAISLTDALTEIQTLYEEQNDVDLTFNLLGSGSLAQQIQQGAPVDLFISANEDWMNVLNDNDFLLNNTRAHITGNRLVLIAGEDVVTDHLSIEETITQNKPKIAIGNPESVPAGAYTMQVLENIQFQDQLKEQVILSKDVRQVLTYVETGNVQYGFVYESDALASSRVTIVEVLDEQLHEAITYPGAVLRSAKHPEEARHFLTFLQSDEAQNVFEKYGFRQ